MDDQILPLVLANDIGISGYATTFVLGLIGHSCSFLTFSQRQLRTTSTTLLFLSVTTFDMSYLFMSLYDFILINLGIPQLSPYYISLCRFRTFILNFAQTASAWLLVCIAFDRFVRARLPHRVRQWCTHKNVIIAICLTILCSIAFNSHVLQSTFVTTFPLTRVICGPSRVFTTDYTTFYYVTWPILQITINILAPALLMIISIIVIYKKVRHVGAVRRTHHLENQMLILMLSKTILFLVCTLPYGGYRLSTINSLDPQNQTEYIKFLIITSILTILLDAYFSIAFYIDCLTSTLFRKIFINTLKKCLSRQRHNAIRPVTINL